jgi:hypothetical protein
MNVALTIRITAAASLVAIAAIFLVRQRSGREYFQDGDRRYDLRGWK